MNHHPEHHPFLFWGVVLTAFALHAGFLFYAHGQKISAPLLSSKAYMENQNPPVPLVETFQTREEETHRKNEQLAVLFQQLIPTPIEISPSSLPDASLTDSKIEIAVPSQIPESEPGSLETPFAVISDSSPTQSLESSAIPPPDVSVLFAHDDSLTHELIMATELAQGKLEPTQATVDSSTPTIKAGREEGIDLGSSLQNRSGMLDQGRTDTLQGAAPALAYAEMEALADMHMRSLIASGQGHGSIGVKGTGLEDLGTIASSDDFTLDIQVAPRIYGQGYLFRIELIPKPGVKFRRIVQNYFFLIDRSHSIRYSRYDFTRQAVAKALDMLQPGDTFNLFVFDDHVVAFRPQNVAWTKDNLEQAREFLSQQKYGGLFATTDLYASLGKIVPEAVGENEINTAVLLSDGDTFLSSEKQRDSIGKWTMRNSGKVSLYSVASGKGNNLALLDLLSFFNKGQLHYSPSDNSIGASLFQLMQAVRNPIGKQMTLTAIRPSADVEIVLYPAASTMPNLYEHSPFVVYGTINRLQDFNLFFQGKYYQRLLDIKQNVSFAQARRGDSAALEKRWALYQAYANYAEFMRDGNMSHLARAKQFLKPYKIQSAFQ